MAADVDIFDPRVYTAGGVPHEEFTRLRHEAPVSWHEEPALLGWEAGPGFWAVVRHEDVLTVLRDPERFSTYLGGTQIRDPQTDEDLDFLRRGMINQDAPEHTRIRSMISRSFTPRAVRNVETVIRNRAKTIVDRVIERGEADFAKEISADLPLLTLAEVMGVPAGDRMLLFDWSNRVIGYQDDEYASSAAFDPTDASPMALLALERRDQIERGPDGRMPDPRSYEGMADLYVYASALAAKRRQEPGDDIMSLLLTAEHEDGAVTDEEFEAMFFLFAVAGNETLRNGIPGGLNTLFDHPEQLERLRDDLDLLPTAVDEMLRFAPPVLHFRRTATCDTELADRRIKAGQKVVVYFVSANRDETVFDDPQRFDIARDPNPHLTFGSGPHFCVGSHLAKQQMAAMFTEILTRMPDLERSGPPERLQSNFQSGYKHLPIRWTV